MVLSENFSKLINFHKFCKKQSPRSKHWMYEVSLLKQLFPTYVVMHKAALSNSNEQSYEVKAFDENMENGLFKDVTTLQSFVSYFI